MILKTLIDLFPSLQIQDFIWRSLGLLFGVVTLLIVTARILHSIQLHTHRAPDRNDDESYLRALIAFLRQLHLHGSFDEAFFVEREFRLKNCYEPRSFF